MIITCPHCEKQHNIDEKRIPANVKMARCQGCGQQFPLKLDKPVAPPAAPTAHPTSTSTPTPTPQDQDPPIPSTTPSGKTRRIGVSLSKGGVGKTTTSVNLAAGLALAGKKVLLVDTDTQGQSSFMLGLKPKGGLTELVTEELSPQEAIVEAANHLPASNAL